MIKDDPCNVLADLDLGAVLDEKNIESTRGSITVRYMSFRLEATLTNVHREPQHLSPFI